MSRTPTGSVVERKTAKGRTFALRTTHDGQRVQWVIGSTASGMTRRDADRELRQVLAAQRLGQWTPPGWEPEPEAEAPRLHAFATDWYRAKLADGGRTGRGIAENTRADLERLLTIHVLPWWVNVAGDPELRAIGPKDVDRFRRHLLAEGRLGPAQINRALATLASILDVAVEYSHAARNPAAGRRRRLRVEQPERTYLERAEHIAALLDAATDLDHDGRGGPFRAPLLGVLALGGLRIAECLALEWRDVDLAGGTIRVRGTKTAAAARTVDLLPRLRDILASYAAAEAGGCSGLLFATASGTAMLPSNVRRRVLAPAAALASTRLAADGLAPLPERLTPHSLRRTYASALVALGVDPAYAMGQLGHTSPQMTLGIYARAIGRRDGQREALRAYVGVDGEAAAWDAAHPLTVPAEWSS